MKRITEAGIHQLEEKIKAAKDDLVILKQNAEEYREASTDAFVNGKDPVAIVSQRRVMDGKVELLEDGISAMESSLAEMKANLPKYRELEKKAEERVKVLESEQVDRILKYTKALYAAWELAVDSLRARNEALKIAHEFDPVSVPAICLEWGEYDADQLGRQLNILEEKMPEIFAKSKVPGFDARLQRQYGE